MTNGNAAARRQAILASAIGNLVEWYDFSLYGYFATTIAAAFFPKSDPTAGLLSTFAIFAVGFLVRPLGAIVFGHIGDRHGRRPALVLAVGLMSVGTLVIGVLPTYAQIGALAPVLLLLCRIVQGFSAGGESTSATVYLVEHAPQGRRGRYASLIPSIGVLSMAVAALVAAAMTSATTPEQLDSWGWRIPFLMAAPLALIGMYLRMRIEESPVFATLRSEGDIESAPLVQAFKDAKKPILIFIGWTTAHAVGLYLISTFLVSYLNTTAKFSKTESLLLVVVALLIDAVGVLLAGYAIDKVGRKPVAVTSALCTAAFAVPAFVWLEHPSLSTAFLVIGVFVFLYTGIPATTYLAMVELFPAHFRSSASSFAYNISYTVFGGTAPYLATWLVGGGHFLGPGYYLAGLCIVAAIAATIGIGNRSTQGDRADDVPTLTEGQQQANV